MSVSETVFLQVVFVGPAGVGKSALVNRIMNRLPATFVSKPQAIRSYVNFSVKEVKIRNRKYKLDMCDTHGDLEQFHLQLTSCNAIVLVFDLTLRDSFFDIPKIFERVREITKGEKPVIVVGNKVDLTLDRLVEGIEARRLAHDLNVPYFEISANTGENIQELLVCLTTSTQHVS